MRQHGTMSLRLRIASSTVPLAALALLAGCSFASPQLAVLDTDRVAADELPTLVDGDYEPVDESSSRTVGEYEGVSLWVARGTESPVCLIAVAAADDWIIGCGGAPVRVGGGDHTFELRADGVPAPDRMTRVSDNVYAQ